MYKEGDSKHLRNIHTNKPVATLNVGTDVNPCWREAVGPVITVLPMFSVTALLRYKSSANKKLILSKCHFGHNMTKCLFLFALIAEIDPKGATIN